MHHMNFILIIFNFHWLFEFDLISIRQNQIVILQRLFNLHSDTRLVPTLETAIGLVRWIFQETSRFQLVWYHHSWLLHCCYCNCAANAKTAIPIFALQDEWPILLCSPISFLRLAVTPANPIWFIQFAISSFHPLISYNRWRWCHLFSLAWWMFKVETWDSGAVSHEPRQAKQSMF